MDDQKFQKYITIIEHKTKLKFSDEQLAVLHYQYQTPVLINSCAGAGKTTLLMISIIMKMLDGTAPSHILAITFSKEAQLDMATKFDQLLDQLGVRPQTKPTFKTFDALFLQLLKKIKPDVNVLNGGYQQSKINHAQRNAMQYHHAILSDNDLLHQYNEFKDQLINHQYSYDGYHLRLMANTSENYAKLGQKLHLNHSDKFYQDYPRIIQIYLNAKESSNLVDFNDLKMLLLKSFGNAKDRHIIEMAMEPYEQVFIDEFQDINSVQWELMNKLLSPIGKEHLAMIGDDDQSIYSFRGSNPNIILNLQHTIPDLKTFNLTINYRTAGQVLKYVTPLIQHNQYRLPKVLNVFSGHANQGKLIEFIGNEYQSGKHLLMQDLIQKLKDPHILNENIVVLCRNNIDIALASDYLAHQGLYLNVRKPSNILQNDRDYRSFLSLIESLIFDHFNPYYKNANRMGFQAYSRHIDDVLRHNHLKSVDRLSDYLKMAKEYNHQFAKQYDFHDQTNMKCDKNAGYLMQQLTNLDTLDVELSPGQMVFSAVNHLTKTYHTYMQQHHYIDINHYNEMFNYLHQKLIDVTDIKSWLKQEAKQADKLASMIDQSTYRNDDDPADVFTPASFLTIHSAKGLQFDYVYVYNPRANGLSPMELQINKIFKPNLTKLEFVHLLQSHCGNQFKTNLKYQELYELNQTFDQIYKHAKKKHRQKQFIDKLTGKRKMPRANQFYDQFISQYQLVTSLSHDVEDERRLLYVALTRSIKAAYYSEDLTNHADSTTPLLTELTTPVTNQLMENDQHQLVDVKTAHQNDGYDQNDEDELKNILNHL